MLKASAILAWPSASASSVARVPSAWASRLRPGAVGLGQRSALGAGSGDSGIGFGLTALLDRFGLRLGCEDSGGALTFGSGHRGGPFGFGGGDDIRL